MSLIHHQPHCSIYCGRNGSLLVLVDLPLLGEVLMVVSVCISACEMKGLVSVFFVSLCGRICSLGFISVPEFSAASW